MEVTALSKQEEVRFRVTPEKEKRPPSRKEKEEKDWLPQL